MTAEMPISGECPSASHLAPPLKNIDNRETEEVKCQLRKCTGLKITIKISIKGRLHIEAGPEVKT